MSGSEERSWAEEAVEAARAGAEALLGEPAQQARTDGVKAAMDATRRLGEIFTREGPLGGTDGADGAGTDEESYRRFRAETERMFDAWMDIMRSAFSASMEAVDQAFQSTRGASFDESDAVRLAPIIAGEATAATLWIRNPTDGPLIGIELTCSTLVSEAGDLITADQVELSPASIDLVDAQSSVAVSVRLKTRSDAVGGLYRGMITSQGLPNALVMAEIVSRPE